MDIKKAQEVVEEIEAICKKHNVALIGGCITEGIYGEIQIADVDDLIPDEIDHLSSGDRPYINNRLVVVNGIS